MKLSIGCGFELKRENLISDSTIHIACDVFKSCSM